MFIDVLKNKKEVDPGFFFDYQVDENNRLKNVFWSDSLSRRSYAVFGDILLFDMIHKTSPYSMVFAPFTRLNHYKQLVCFGAGPVKLVVELQI